MVPVYNEIEVLAVFHRQLCAVIDKLDWPVEILYVDDGSADGTGELLAAFRDGDARMAVATFSRNFGKEAAMTAGLHLARGEAVILIDADLQDPPGLMPQMLEAWAAGADVVTMRRETRSGETRFKNLSAYAFYRVFNYLSETPLPADTGDFRLLSRRVVDAINRLPERNRFMKGIFSWVGFKSVTIPYHREPRADGQTKWSALKLWRLAVEGIVGFSAAPLRLATYVGISCAVLSFLYAIYFLGKTVFFGEPTHGFPTLIICMLSLGGIQLTAIGILGEYVGRLFMEAKQRPLFLLEDYVPAVGLSPEAPRAS